MAHPNPPRAKLSVVDGVQVFARRNEAGLPCKVDSIAEDRDKIADIADRLQRAGYGVFRERNARAGRVYYRLGASWAGPGEPPEHPLGPA